MFKAQVSRPGPNKHEWSERWDGWMPGWHTVARGTERDCENAILAYLSSRGGADTRVVPTAKRDDQD